MKDTDLQHKFIELRSKGYSYDKIAKVLNIHRNTCINWNNKFKDQISKEQDLIYEELYTQTKIALDNRLKAFIYLQNKILEEIKSRDFKNIPTTILIDKFFNINDKISDTFEKMTDPDYEEDSKINEDLKKALKEVFEEEEE